MRKLTFYLPDQQATDQLGAALAAVLRPGLVLYLHGDLGAGKTALTRAMLHAAGFAGHVKSPTYTLVEPYSVQLDGKTVTVNHFDLYRLGHPEEFLDAGFRDEFNPGNICIVEWPEKGEGVLPPPDIHVFLQIKQSGRDVELQGLSALGAQCLDRLHAPPSL